jgi:hypothetical protein
VAVKVIKAGEELGLADSSSPTDALPEIAVLLACRDCEQVVKLVGESSGAAAAQAARSPAGRKPLLH